MRYRIEANATFKQAKALMMKRSWDLNAPGNSDQLYWLNGHKYKRLDVSDWGAIEYGRAKL
jgi:hypothetical protein